ncbi:PAS domain S-box protein [Methanobacterium ferruginis]|uniref:PAS domain S-box protein n=1 Tax=Methanobacterium ferruginis TaxID=710191 RepID=UPI002572AF6B|nr:PAS domain S-box protein [Methanobacterium ferruginis]BDZ66735.1 histidine kinase [Methanobacterium ferruginis]
MLANILIVEDETVEAMNLKTSLQLMGYNVLAIASRGDEAVEKAKKLKPDLILMDVILKGDMDGIEAAEIVKKLKIPVIYITALPDDATVNRALLSEPYGYLIKPFDDRKLKVSIEVALYKNQMEKKVKKSNKGFYKVIFENTGTSTVIIEEDMTLSLVNTEFSQLTGYSKKEIEGKLNWTEFFASDDLPMMKEFHALRRINPDDAPRNYEARLITRNNDIRTVYLTVALLPGTKKSMASIVDLTELQRSKKEIEKSKKKFKTIFENAAEAMILFDRYGTILEANDKIEEISGFRKEELIGHKFMKLLPKVKIEYLKALKAFKDIISGNELKQVEWTIKNKVGKEVVFMAHPSVLRTENRIDGLVMIIEDVTDRKRVENTLRTSLEEKEVLLREIHHRVKNNLQIISSLLSLQCIQLDDDETVDVLRECQGRVRTMAMIHENLYQSKDINHINFGNFVKKLLSDIFYSYRVDPRSIKLTTNVENVEIGIETAMPCGLIINELATNSIKHAFPTGTGNISVELTSSGLNNDSFILIFDDDGIGLPENLTPENTKKLGLMVVNTLSNQLNAEMEIDRSNGTRFIFKFSELPYIMRL